MDYEDVTHTFARHQTKHVRFVPLSNSCAPNRIPKSFLTLFADIVFCIERNLHKFCGKNEFIALFGIQPALCPIASTLAINQHRAYDNNNPRNHFCCSIDYLILPKSKPNSIHWKNSKSIIVDFTSGLIMDSQAYMNKLLKKQHVNSGVIFSKIKEQKLEEAWLAFNKK